MDCTLIVKDHILKKCRWFYEFDDIFYKQSCINPTLIIESGQPPKLNGAAVDDNDLRGYDFNFNQDLEDPCQMATYEIEGKKDISISFSNFLNLSSGCNLSLDSALV